MAAGQISLLQSRPLGLKGGDQPAASHRRGRPRTARQARRNAPLTTLTLDRLVSLQDYEDFTRAFAGIAKAQAAWLWDGGQRTRIDHCRRAERAGGRTRRARPTTAWCRRSSATGCPTSLSRWSPIPRSALACRHASRWTRGARPDLVLASGARRAARRPLVSTRATLARGVAASQVLAAIQPCPGVVMADLNTLLPERARRPSTALPLPPLRANPARATRRGDPAGRAAHPGREPGGIDRGALDDELNDLRAQFCTRREPRSRRQHGLMKLPMNRLYDLLPAIYRLRDDADGRPAARAAAR